MENAGAVDAGGGSTGRHLAFSVLSVFKFLAAPFAGGVEVFQAKTDGIDLAMATGALGFLYVNREFLPLSEGFVSEASAISRKLWLKV